MAWFNSVFSFFIAFFPFFPFFLSRDSEGSVPRMAYTSHRFSPSEGSLPACQTHRFPFEDCSSAKLKHPCFRAGALVCLVLVFMFHVNQQWSCRGPSLAQLTQTVKGSLQTRRIERSLLSSRRSGHQLALQAPSTAVFSRPEAQAGLMFGSQFPGTPQSRFTYPV